MKEQAAGPDLFGQVNTPKDLDNMTDLEKKHFPVITAPDCVKAGEAFDVTMEVGKFLAHPNERGHHIEFIDLYENRVFLARVDLSAVRTQPKVTLTVSLPISGMLRAFESCNLHGVWEAEKPIEVCG